jgi:hypothetical protein
MTCRFVRNQALEELIDYYAKKIAVQLIVKMDNEGCPDSTQVMAFDNFSPLLYRELSRFLYRVETEPDVLVKEDEPAE